MARVFWVYVIASGSNRLYVGVTNDLRRRLHEHRTGQSIYSGRWQSVRLVHAESTPNVRAAIAREKELKGWRRAKKVALIEASNLGWIDLAEGWFEEAAVGSGGENPSSLRSPDDTL